MIHVSDIYFKMRLIMPSKSLLPSSDSERAKRNNKDADIYTAYAQINLIP